MGLAPVDNTGNIMRMSRSVVGMWGARDDELGAEEEMSYLGTLAWEKAHDLLSVMFAVSLFQSCALKAQRPTIPQTVNLSTFQMSI